jgi:FkbM family methyltransferase
MTHVNRPFQRLSKMYQLPNHHKAATGLKSFACRVNSRDHIFIDCGANDGCSAIKYLHKYPEAKVLSLEPNPVLAKYHWIIPNTLLVCAVANKTGLLELRVDPVDSDGSSILSSKPVVFDKSIQNSDCPLILVESIDIVTIIKAISESGAKIVLKLDIEGAEYDVIDRLSEANMLGCISAFYCEFHWDRIGMQESAHLAKLAKLEQELGSLVQEWDACDFMLANRIDKAKWKMRRSRLTSLAKTYLSRIMYLMNRNRR